LWPFLHVNVAFVDGSNQDLNEKGSRPHETIIRSETMTADTVNNITGIFAGKLRYIATQTTMIMIAIAGIEKEF
jgi:hypothetical protein